MEEGYYWITVVGNTPEVGYYMLNAEGAGQHRWFRIRFPLGERPGEVTVLSTRLRSPQEPPLEAE